MPFFKLLGGSAPVNNPIGVMTEGIGYPLRQVDQSASGGSVSVIIETAILAASEVD